MVLKIILITVQFYFYGFIKIKTLNICKVDVRAPFVSFSLSGQRTTCTNRIYVELFYFMFLSNLRVKLPITKL